MTKIVGILNITPDSFSDGGKFNSLEKAINHLHQMISDGASIIDIGAESTRPSAIKISPKEEWHRLHKILPQIVLEIKKYPQKIKTSIDSYHFETIKKSHDLGIDIINDVSGLSDERIVRFIAEKNIETILMHNLPIPTDENLWVNPHQNTTSRILNWSQRKISDLEKKGVKKSQLIFDPGIGFAKNAQQSIRILKYINTYKSLGLPIYIGHSKKSFLDEVKIPNADTSEKTLAISKYLIGRKVDFLRVHDIRKHADLIKNLNNV